ncbi:hypothetical protein BOX15_Mlig020096g1, partial [Macrostomum lignano]
KEDMKLPAKIHILDATPITLNDRFTGLQYQRGGGHLPRRRPYDMRRGAPSGRNRGGGGNRYEGAMNDRLRGVLQGRIERPFREREVVVVPSARAAQFPASSPAGAVGRGGPNRRSHAFRVGRNTVEFVNSNRLNRQYRNQPAGYPGNVGGYSPQRRYGVSRGVRQGGPSRRGRGGRGFNRPAGAARAASAMPDYIIEEKPAEEKARLDRDLDAIMREEGSALNMELTTYYKNAKAQDDF